MQRIRWALLDGTLDVALSDSDTVMESVALADAPVVADGDVLVVILDPLEEAGIGECVYVTAHTAASNTATITRGEEQASGHSPPRAHGTGIAWANNPTPADFGGGKCIQVVAEQAPAPHTDLTTVYTPAGDPVLVSAEGMGAMTRACVLPGTPADWKGQVVAIVPDGDSVSAPHFGFERDSPAVLADIAEAYGAASNFDFSGAGSESFELTQGATAYTATLSIDYTSDPLGAYQALVDGWNLDGATVSMIAGYTDIFGQRRTFYSIVTDGEGSAETLAITDAGAGDPLGLTALTATPGYSNVYEGLSNSVRGTGDLNDGHGYPFSGQTHCWPDEPGCLHMLVVASDGEHWWEISAISRPHLTAYTPTTAGDWSPVPANVQEALDTLASFIASIPALSAATPVAPSLAGVAGSSPDASRADHSHPSDGLGTGLASSAMPAATVGTLLVPCATVAAATAIPLGSAYICTFNGLKETTISALGLKIDATSLTGSQVADVSLYTLAGTLLWAESIVVGTSTGSIWKTGLSRTRPSSGILVFTNPSGNSGTVSPDRVVPSGVVEVLHDGQGGAQGWVTTGHAGAPASISTSAFVNGLTAVPLVYFRP